MNFEDWMVAQGLSDSSIKKYASAIDGPLTNWGNGTRIRSISDPDEFAALAELISDTDIFAQRNGRGNYMYSSALKNYGQYLLALTEMKRKDESGPFSVELASLEADAESSEQFEPLGQTDARNRVLQEVVRRKGQTRFRAQLITLYGGCCAITGCSQLDALEAAHVTPYLGPNTNLTSNGILFRADIHTLWDLGLIAIDPVSLTVAVCASVHDRDYQALNGRLVSQPIEPAAQLSKAALQCQWDVFRKYQERWNGLAQRA